MCCHLVGCGMPMPMAPRMQSATPNTGVDHMMRRSAVDTRPHPTNILPQSMKRLFQWQDFADDFGPHLIFHSLFWPSLISRY
jgi:hypothetical protein